MITAVNKGKSGLLVKNLVVEMLKLNLPLSQEKAVLLSTSFGLMVVE